ncbi:hypothetical protein ABZ614_41095 [Streptomyces sp. NPDC013178]|uniref:hypothetical protein n=1 Tax=unclassified Streptomyces TaxID=2593676 RepID=UPI0033E0051A
MGSVLKGVPGVRWGDLRGAQAPARDIPPLLSRIAWGGEDAARLAIDDLGDCICALGFVVGEATAPTVPFLLELAEAPFVPCKPELLELLEKIYRTQTWHSSAVAADGPKRKNFQEQPGWEVAARAAVLAGRRVIEGLAGSVQPEVADAARRLLRAIDEDPGLPGI